MSGKIFKPVTGMTPGLLKLIELWSQIIHHACMVDCQRSPKVVYRMFNLIYYHFALCRIIFHKECPAKESQSGKEPLWGAFAHRIQTHFARCFCLIPLAHVSEQLKEQQFKFWKFVTDKHWNGHSNLALVYMMKKEGAENFKRKYGRNRATAQKAHCEDKSAGAQYWRLTHSYPRTRFPALICRPNDPHWQAYEKETHAWADLVWRDRATTTH